MRIQVEATFRPVEPKVIEPNFKVYGGPFVIKSVATPKSVVAKDDPLIAFDTTWINWQTEAAEGDLAVATAGLERAEAEAKVAATSDPMALRQAEDALRNAEGAKKWFDDVDGPQLLQSADLQAKRAQDSVDDQNDELEQLRKMYGAEELTTATADIVIRRAVRSLEQAKILAKVAAEDRDKIKAYDFPIQRQRVTDQLESARHQLALTRAQLAQSAVNRENGLKTAKLAVSQATRRMEDLKADQALMQIRAPDAGIVEFGNRVEGNWVGLDADDLKVGDKVAAGDLLVRVYKPDRLRLQVVLPESQAFWVKPGMKAKVIPAAAPQKAELAPIASLETINRAKPPGLLWVANIEVESPDDRLRPGMRGGRDDRCRDGAKTLCSCQCRPSSTAG